MIFLIAIATAPSGALAATIGGTVSEAQGAHTALEGVQVCPKADPYTFETSCVFTDFAGRYVLSVPSGTYTIRFDDSVRNRNLVSQSYGGSPYFPGQTVTVGAGSETATADAQLEPGGTITGTVTDAVSHVGIEGTPVCATAEHGLEGTTGRCELSGAGGTYTINGLPPGDYQVEFQSGYLNYQEQRYDDSAWPQPPTFVPVAAAGETVGGIDAAMRVGAEIAGRVTDTETGAALPGISVEALAPERGSEWFVTRSTITDANGDYVLSGLPEGEYRIAFATDHGESLGTCFQSQFYAGSQFEIGSTTVRGLPGEVVGGIDAALTRLCELPRAQPPVTGVAAVSQVPLARSDRGGHAPRCRKGFRRHRVRGVVRCVLHHPRAHNHRPRRPHES